MDEIACMSGQYVACCVNIAQNVQISQLMIIQSICYLGNTNQNLTQNIFKRPHSRIQCDSRFGLLVRKITSA